MKTHISHYVTVFSLIVALLSFFVSPLTSQAPGDLDLSFGVAGEICAQFIDDGPNPNPFIFNRSSAMAIDEDRDRIYVIGDVTGGIGISAFNLNGTIDSTFNSDGKLSIELDQSFVANDILILPNGELLICGHNDNMLLIKVNLDGTLKEDWGTDGVVSVDVTSEDDRAKRIAVRDNGSIVIGGWVDTGINDIVVTQLTETGELDTNFGDGGSFLLDIEEADRVEGLILQSDGKILVSGSSRLNGFVMRLTEDGQLDSSFNGIGYNLFNSGTFGQFGDIDLQPDNKIIVAYTKGAVVRYNIDGTIDTSFGDDGLSVVVDGGKMCDIKYHPSGRIFLFGHRFQTPTNLDRDFIILAYDLEGNLISDFGADGTAVYDFGEGEDYGRRGLIDFSGDLYMTGEAQDREKFVAIKVIGYALSFIDLDQDGYDSMVDCDDNNPSVNPGQSEIPYNGIDDDCNASTEDDDVDQDGYGVADDCDDSNPNIFPGQFDILDNGIDEDCDGVDATTSNSQEVCNNGIDDDGDGAIDCDDSDCALFNQIDLPATHDFCEGMGGTIEAITGASPVTWYYNGFLLPGQTGTTNFATLPGVYTAAVGVGTACEKSASTTVTFLPTTVTSETHYLCQGGIVTVNGSDYNIPGEYSVALSSAGDCDNILNFEIIELPSVVLSQNYVTCEGEVVMVDGQAYADEGNYTLTYPEALGGCDTIFNFSIAHLPIVRQEKYLQITADEPAVFNGVSYDTEGHYTVSLPASSGCDTICDITVTAVSCLVNYNFDDCYSSVTLGAHDYSEFLPEYPESPACGTIAASVFQRVDPIVNQHSCTDGLDGTPAICISSEDSCEYMPNSDKSGRIVLSVKPEAGRELSISQLSFSQAAPEMFQWSHTTGQNNYPTLFGVRIIMDGIEVFRAEDMPTTQTWSEVVLDLDGAIIVSADSNIEIQFLGYCLVGNGAAVSAFDLDDIRIYGGCSPEEMVPVAEICDNGIDDDLDGAVDCADTDLANDCCCKDPENISLASHDLCNYNTFNLEAQTTYVGAFAWSKDGTSLSEKTSTLQVTESGTYTVSITDECGNVSEASSVVTFREVVDISLPSTSSFCEGMGGMIQANTTASFVTWYFNGFLLPGQNGPSVFVSEPGVYTAVVSDGTPCATIASTTVSFLPSSLEMETYYICAGESVTVSGFTYNVPGIYSLSLGAEGDCSQVLNFEIIETPGVSIQDEFFLCEGESVTVEGLNYFDEGDYTLVLPSSDDGCDTVYNFKLTYLPQVQLEKTLQITDGMPVEFNGESYDTPGRYIVTLPSENGCDSICIINVSEEGCLVNYNFDACESFINVGADDYSEFVAEYPVAPSCATISASSFQRINPTDNRHSCTEGLDGTAAICISSDDSCDYNPDSDKSGRIIMSISADTGSELVLSSLSFSQAAPQMYQWSNSSGLNNYPTKFGVRIMQDGTEVYRADELTTTTAWSEVVLDLNDEVVVSGDSNLEIQFLGYCLIGNGAVVSAFDLENIRIYGGCRQPAQSRLFAGTVALRGLQQMQDVEITSSGNDLYTATMTDNRGAYAIDGNRDNVAYSISARMDENHLEGVSTLDLVMIQRHILGLELLQSPLDRVAADIDKNGLINGLDLVELRKLILGIYTELPHSDSYRFFDKKSAMRETDPAELEQYIRVEGGEGHSLHLDFVGVKIGDVNGAGLAKRSSENIDLLIQDQVLESGTTVKVPVYAQDFEKVIGLQAALNFDPAALSFKALHDGAIAASDLSLGLEHLEEGLINLNWISVEGLSADAGEALFELEFMVQESSVLSKAIALNDQSLKAEAYNAHLETRALDLSFISATENLLLYHNSPNPFSSATTISFDLPSDSEVTFTVYDVSGKELIRKLGNYKHGMNTITLDADELTTPGMLYYKIETDSSSASSKMILLR